MEDWRGHGGQGGQEGTRGYGSTTRGPWRNTGDSQTHRGTGGGTRGDNQAPRGREGTWGGVTTNPSGGQQDSRGHRAVGCGRGRASVSPPGPHPAQLGRQEGNGCPLMLRVLRGSRPLGVSRRCPMGVPWVSPLSHLVGLHGPAQVLDPAVALGQGRAPKGPAALARDDLGAGRVSWWWWWWGHPRVPGEGCAEGFGCPRLRGWPFRVPWVPLRGAWGASLG